MQSSMQHKLTPETHKQQLVSKLLMQIAAAPAWYNCLKNFTVCLLKRELHKQWQPALPAHSRNHQQLKSTRADELLHSIHGLTLILIATIIKERALCAVLRCCSTIGTSSRRSLAFGAKTVLRGGAQDRQTQAGWVYSHATRLQVL